MIGYETPETFLDHTVNGDLINLSWTEKGDVRKYFTVHRDTADATAGSGDPVTAADGRVLQMALNKLGYDDLGRAVFDRYGR